MKSLTWCLAHNKYSINVSYSSCHYYCLHEHQLRGLDEYLTFFLVSSFSGGISGKKIILSNMVKEYDLNNKEQNIRYYSCNIWNLFHISENLFEFF